MSLAFFKQLCNNPATMSFTYKPHKRKRARTHGFLERQSTTSGRNTIRRRRQKGRAKLAV